MDAKTEELLTVQEVATMLRVDETTVRRWIKVGTLNAIKLPNHGRRVTHRIRRSTVHSLLAPYPLSKSEGNSDT